MVGLFLASALSENEVHPVAGNTRFEARLGGHCAVQIPYAEDSPFYSIGDRERRVGRTTSNVKEHPRFPSAFGFLDAEIVERDRFHVGALLMTPGIQRLARGCRL